jgi:hypothetical protein
MYRTPAGFPLQPPRRRKTRSVARIGGALFLVLVLVGTLLVSGAVWTNAFGAGERFDNLMDRVRLAVNPPPDREITPTVQVTEPPAETAGSGAGASLEPTETGEPGPRATHKPPRKPINFKLETHPDTMFISQQTNSWCASAGVQMALAIQGLADNTPGLQKRIHERLGEWESRRDATAGGWGPASMQAALAAYGATGYEVRAYERRARALHDAAAALKQTGRPVILIAWRGAHTWVMTGFRATADPTVYRDAQVTGTYIYDPWYPRVSTIWGPSDPPGTFQNQDEMDRNFLQWQRPEGPYPDRDGKYLIVVPTTPLA